MNSETGQKDPWTRPEEAVILQLFFKVIVFKINKTTGIQTIRRYRLSEDRS